MKTFNKVFLMGYVAQEPTEKNFENGTKCVHLVIKTRDFYGPSSDRKVDKNFHNCILWNGIADMVTTILQKGDVVHIVGRLKNKKIEGKNGEKAQFKTEIVIEEWTKIVTEDNDDD